MRNKIISAIAALIVCLSGVTAHAYYDDYGNYYEDAGTYEEYSDDTYYDETAYTEEYTETEPERTISTAGNGHIVDDISDSEYLQFITVTARNGNVFYVVIDRQNSNDNVYFLNTVDESDIAALVEDYTPLAVETPAPAVTPMPEESPQAEEKPVAGLPKGVSGNMLIVILALVGIGGLAAYYFKIYLPKKKLEDADDLDDFEFVNDEGAETEVEDDFYSDDDLE